MADHIPSVSVLMTVYNGMPYVESAVRALMRQTLTDIEIIIVDDASTDRTPEILIDLAKEDSRIRVVTLATNMRQAHASNQGLELAIAPYVARMDADDLAEIDWLEIEKEYLDTHPDILLVGASIHHMDSQGKNLKTSIRGRDIYTTNWTARFQTPFAHNTIMFRRTGFNGQSEFRYNPEVIYADDYDFCTRLMQVGKAVNLPAPLVHYRIHGASLSQTNWLGQLADARKISIEVQRRELPSEIFDALEDFRAAYFGLENVSVANIFSGFRKLLAYDTQISPNHSAWIRRQAVQLIASAIRRKGGSRSVVIGDFLKFGRDFLPAAIMRGLEIKRLLPKRFHSEPDV